MTKHPSSTERRRFLAHGLAVGLLAVPSLVLAGAALAQQRVPAKIYRTPGCGCCMGWVRHLQSNGFAPAVNDLEDLGPTKERLGVPRDLESCHSAEIAGYVIEGHVPAPAIRTLLALKPDFVGIAVPGMPIGSPGMEGPNPERYEVIAWRKDGARSVFMRF
jgi:hypothetical protein